MQDVLKGLQPVLFTITTIINAGFQPENEKKPLRILLRNGLSICHDGTKAQGSRDFENKKRTMKIYLFHSSYFRKAAPQSSAFFLTLCVIMVLL